MADSAALAKLANHLDLARVAHTWNLPEPLRATPLPGGTNNLILRIESANGPYVLRVYRNMTDRTRLQFEGDILRRLGALSLPFAVPAPLPSAAGEHIIALPLAGETALSVLEPFFPGMHPEGSNLALAEAAGADLAILDDALAAIPDAVMTQAVTWRSYGDLEHTHPLVPNPRVALGVLPLAREIRTRLLAAYDALMAAIPGLYAVLPQQLTHEDFAPSNTLAEAGRLTAILDFEFCSRDVRVMDLVVGLSWWPGRAFGSGEEWPILRAFAQGYGLVLRLTDAEVRAVPTLYLLRAYTSLIHRLGRYRQALSPLEAVLDRAAAALAREDWLRANGDRFVALLGEAVGGAG